MNENVIVFPEIWCYPPYDQVAGCAATGDDAEMLSQFINMMIIRNQKVPEFRYH